MGWKSCDGQFRYLPPCELLALLLKETFRIKSANSTRRISICSSRQISEILYANQCKIFTLMFRNNRASFGNRRTENYQYKNCGKKGFVTCFGCSGSTEHMEITWSRAHEKEQEQNRDERNDFKKFWSENKPRMSMRL